MCLSVKLCLFIFSLSANNLCVYQTLKPEDVLLIRYEDLKNPDIRCDAIGH